MSITGDSPNLLHKP